MNPTTGLLIIVFCVALACYIFIRSRRLGKKNKK